MTRSSHNRKLLHKRWQYLIFILLLIIVEVAGAANVTDLFEAEVAVQGQGAEQRKQAIQAAFVQMLIKVTGNRNIGSRREIEADISKAQRYVQQYRYRLASFQSDVMTDDPSGIAGNAAKAQTREDEIKAQAKPSRLLKVTFDEQAVSGFLRERRLPVWSENRPSSLVWLGLEQNRERRLMLPERDIDQISVLKQTAEQRGLPLIFPLMDLEDQNNLQIPDLWGAFEPNIRKASQRYNPDLIIAVRLTQVSPSLWQAKWNLYQSAKVSHWTSEGQSREQITADGLHYAADLIAKRLAPMEAGTESQEFHLKVRGIDNLRDYVKVTKFLRSQGLVQQIRTALVEPEAVTYAFSIKGGIQDLERSLSLSSTIEPDMEIFSDDESWVEHVDLYYKLPGTGGF